MNRSESVRSPKDGSQPALLVKPLDASKMLGISTRTLWAQTEPRGPIPCVRIGSSVRYSPESLRTFVVNQQAGLHDAGLN